MDFGATRLRADLVVEVVATLLVLPPVGRRLDATCGINSGDEVRYPLMARAMPMRGVWFDLHVRGERTREKPPLLPLTIAAFARIRGSVTEVPAQLPVGLTPIVTVTATVLLLRARM
jgi:4-amino-4-deoxy-L-arabinose transferase-like glycosyltransferase